MLSTFELEANSAQCSLKLVQVQAPPLSSPRIQLRCSRPRVTRVLRQRDHPGARQYQECIPKSCVVASSAPGLTAAL